MLVLHRNLVDLIVIRFMNAVSTSFFFNEWQSSGSPPSAFAIPYDSFRKQCDSTVRDSSHDMNSSAEPTEDIKSKELDYDFMCFFLSSQRLDLYRSIDQRCEDMVSGKSYCITFILVFFFSLCFT